MAAIVIESLTRRYGPRRGIEHVDLSVPDGSLFGFLGPNGAGKTTTIRVLLGFLRPSAGRATVFGLDCWRDGKRIRADVGAIPGDLRLYPALNGTDTLRLVSAIRRRDLAAEGTRLARVFELDLRVRVRQMSRGMRQKLGLILALAPRPRLLVLDEPSTALDPLMQERLRTELRAMATEGRTVFFSSHSLAEVESLCDRVAIVREGRIVADETLDQLRRRAGHEVVLRLREGVPAAAIGELPAAFRDPRPLWSGRTLTGVWRGPAAELIAWLHAQPLDDVSISPPSLEALFRAFYQPEQIHAGGLEARP